MRIAAARATPVRLRFTQPVATAQGVFAERVSILLELCDADGARGYGEAAPWPGFGTESVDAATGLLHQVPALLRGVDLEPGQWTPRLDAHLRNAPTARAAVQGALWDLAARRGGRPAADQLAARAARTCGDVLRQVLVSALLVARDPGALREEAVRARQAGHRAVKLKLGGVPLPVDVARVRALREELGPDVRLRGDANGGWNAAEARAALESLAPFGFEYVEQPMAPEDVAGLAALRRQSPVRIAADESVATEQGAERLLAAGAADVLVLKPATLGGPALALAIAARARQAGVGVVFTHAFESAVGARHALHCAAAWGDATAIHGLVTAGMFSADVAEPVACHDGVADIGTTSGIGIEP